MPALVHDVRPVSRALRLQVHDVWVQVLLPLFNFRRSAMVDFYLPESSCENMKKRLLGLTELPVVGNWCAERPSESMLLAVGLGAWPGIRPNVWWKTSLDVTVDGTVERTGEGCDLDATVRHRQGRAITHQAGTVTSRGHTGPTLQTLTWGELWSSSVHMVRHVH